MAQLDDRLAAPRDDGATRIVSLHEGDSLPRGARFCQIVGSKLEQTGTGSRRVYLVLVEQMSSRRRD
jgi:hypothetical protein